MSKVLIIEDEVAIADLEKDYLELSGFEVETENDGVVGLKRALSEGKKYTDPHGICQKRRYRYDQGTGTWRGRLHHKAVLTE